MYYDLEKDFSDPKPDIDSQLSSLKIKKKELSEEYLSSQKSPEETLKYYHDMLALEEQRSSLLDTKCWREQGKSADLSASLETSRKMRENSVPPKIYLYLLCGFLMGVSRSGFPSDIISFLFIIPLSFLFALPFVLVCEIFFSSYSEFPFFKRPLLAAVVLFVITVVILAFIPR